MTTLALLTLRMSVVLLAALVACLACRRQSAALRHMVLAAGVVAALLVAPLTVALPAWHVLPRLDAVWSRPTPGGENRSAEQFVVAAPVGISVAPVDAAPAAVLGLQAWSAPRAVLGVWLMGVLFGLGVLLTGLVRLARFSSNAVPLADERWLAAGAGVARRLGLSRPVRMLTTPDAAICTWGVWRPLIVVPAHAIEWPDERIATVLGHELAHVSRGDWVMQLAAAVLRAVFWFNPLTWLVHRRLRDEAERACDDTVLRLGTADTAYAAHLLEIARTSRNPTAAFTAAMSMARSSTLEGRVAAMLNTRTSRNVPSPGARAAIVATLVAAACAAAALGLSAQGDPLSLHGSVYDSTGAVLPAVEMALTNDRGIKWTTPTDGEGRFEFTPVGPGEYELEAVTPGFTSYKQKVKLEGPKDWNRIITLQVGNLEETIFLRAKRPQQPAALAAPVPGVATRVRVGGNIKQPAKTRGASPMYPESMRAQGLEGTVPLEAVIGKDGKVIFARVISAQVHPELARAAVDAVEQWEFTPTLLNGVPVEVTMTVSVSFRLVD